MGDEDEPDGSHPPRVHLLADRTGRITHEQSINPALVPVVEQGVDIESSVRAVNTELQQHRAGFRERDVVAGLWCGHTDSWYDDPDARRLLG